MDKDRQMLLQPWEIFIVLHHNILSTRVLHICLYFPRHAYASLLHRLEVNSLLFEIERISNVATTDWFLNFKRSHFFYTFFAALVRKNSALFLIFLNLNNLFRYVIIIKANNSNQRSYVKSESIIIAVYNKCSIEFINLFEILVKLLFHHGDYSA